MSCDGVRPQPSTFCSAHNSPNAFRVTKDRQVGAGGRRLVRQVNMGERRRSARGAGNSGSLMEPVRVPPASPVSALKLCLHATVRFPGVLHSCVRRRCAHL